MLTFKDLENAVCGELVLSSEAYYDQIFISIYDGELITKSTENERVLTWKEVDIKDWSIKKETKKLYQYACTSDGETWYVYDRLFSDDEEFKDVIKPMGKFKRLDHTMIEVDA